MYNTLITIFIEVDDFCKLYLNEIGAILKTLYKKNIDMKHKMTISEIITLTIFFHIAHKTTFKDYYYDVVIGQLKHDFKNLLSYERFVELKNKYSFLTLYFLEIKMQKNRE